MACGPAIAHGCPGRPCPCAARQVSQKAAEEVVKQGGNKDEANAAAQVAAKAAVDATNAAQKSGKGEDLAGVATKAATPVVEAYSKNKNAQARGPRVTSSFAALSKGVCVWCIRWDLRRCRYAGGNAALPN